ncbi:L-lactate utilization protein LutB [Bacillus mesophilus]|nr:L-lactate utilization protein LutB [Bacillus mesophilus]
MIYLNCSKCGLCLSDCPPYQATGNELVTPKAVMLTMLEYPDRLNSLKQECSNYCESTCKGLIRCPMSIELNDYLKGNFNV